MVGPPPGIEYEGWVFSAAVEPGTDRLIAVTLGCVDCHGGNEKVVASLALSRDSSLYRSLMDQAHVQPRFPEFWNYPSSRNPEISYARLNYESPEFVRFMNPSDYRVVRQACGACHTKQIQAAERSIMSTGAMLWGGGAYNNGILPFKKYVLGEHYQALTGEERKEAEESGAPLSVSGILKANVAPDANMESKGVLPLLAPLPAYEVLPPADIFRVFERGGRLIGNTFAEVGLPNESGSIQRLEEPGRPDIRQSNRGPATGARIAIPVLNITKTRLNDPFTWFLEVVPAIVGGGLLVALYRRFRFTDLVCVLILLHAIILMIGVIELTSGVTDNRTRSSSSTTGTKSNCTPKSLN